MTFTQEVAAAIREAGGATADDLLPRFPGKTREQVLKAIKNASYRGYIGVSERRYRQGQSAGRAPFVWAAQVVPKRVSSVWAFAESCRA